MRRLIAIALCAVLALMTVPTAAFADEEEAVSYPVAINGQQLTSDTLSQLPAGVSISANPGELPQLTIENASLTDPLDEAPLITVTGDMRLSVVGENSITTEGDFSPIVIESDATLVVSGLGALNLFSAIMPCVQGGNLVLDGPDFKAVSDDDDALQSNVTFVSGTLTAQAGLSYHAATSFALAGRYAWWRCAPEGDFVSTLNEAVRPSGQYMQVTNDLGVTGAETYGLSVMGVPVTNLNAADVLGDGKVSFLPAVDADTASLKLSNASFSAMDEVEFAIITSIPLKVSGAATSSIDFIYSTSFEGVVLANLSVQVQGFAVRAEGPVTLNSAQITATSGDDAAIEATGLALEGTSRLEITANEGTSPVLLDAEDAVPQLSIDEALVTLEGGEPVTEEEDGIFFTTYQQHRLLIGTPMTDWTASLYSTSLVYTAVKKAPTVTVRDAEGKVMVRNRDYTLAFSNNLNVGTALATVTGCGIYVGTLTVAFDITKATQPLKVSASAKSLKASKLKSKARYTSKVKVSGAKGKVTYVKVSGSKRLAIAKNAGKIKVKRGTKRGTYKIKVKVTSAATANYLKTSKTVTIKVKVK